MNDLSETTYYWDTVYEILNDIYCKYKSDFVEDVMRQVAANLPYSIPKQFAASFSTEGDKLELWDRYGGEHGVALGFEFGAEYKNKHDGSNLFVMKYKQSELIDFVNKAVRLTYDKIFIDKDSHPGIDEPYDEDLDPGRSEYSEQCSLAANTIYMSLYRNVWNFKNPYFSGESEIRLAVEERDVQKDEVNYRVSGSLLVPYIEL